MGVSVRTLHHWDRIGLAPASGRTWSDYRVYDDDDVARIHRILVYRELGLPLAQIGVLLDDPDVDEGPSCPGSASCSSSGSLTCRRWSPQ